MYSVLHLGSSGNLPELTHLQHIHHSRTSLDGVRSTYLCSYTGSSSGFPIRAAAAFMGSRTPSRLVRESSRTHSSPTYPPFPPSCNSPNWNIQAHILMQLYRIFLGFSYPSCRRFYGLPRSWEITGQISPNSLISNISTFPAQLQLTKLEHTSAGQGIGRFTNTGSSSGFPIRAAAAFMGSRGRGRSQDR
jgi:hypothetical protein